MLFPYFVLAYDYDYALLTTRQQVARAPISLGRPHPGVLAQSASEAERLAWFAQTHRPLWSADMPQ